VETIALRLLLPPLVIAVASLAQGRLGDRLGGLVVGLPLTSGTFLGLLHLSHGPEALAHGALGMLGGQIAVVAMCVTYATAAPRHSSAVALAMTLVAWVIGIALVRTFAQGVLVTAALHVLVALAVLAWWPRAEPVTMAGPGRSARHDLVVRVAIGSALVIALTATVETLGSGLAGTLAAAPLVALVLSPSTHRYRGARAVQDLLGGVVRGSLGAAAFGLVVACTAPHLGGLALVAATTACLAVVGLVGRLDSLRP
jgi:hypothetical protein